MSEEAKKIIKKLRTVINDGFTFVRSYETSRALGAVTIEDLINEQIARNGETEKSKKNKYDPYEEIEVASENTPVVTEGKEVGNFVSGTESTNPTKMDRLLAMKNAMTATIDLIKSYDPTEIADIETYDDAAEEEASPAMPSPVPGEVNDIDFPEGGVWW
jgi:hypothetical protein